MALTAVINPVVPLNLLFLTKGLFSLIHVNQQNIEYLLIILLTTILPMGIPLVITLFPVEFDVPLPQDACLLMPPFGGCGILA